MKSMSLHEIANAINAHLIQGAGDKVCTEVSTDTRHLKPGDLFIALSGDNFDAHNFLDKAIDRGAAALVINREIPLSNKDIPLLLVQDTTRALQELAHYNRRQFNIPVIGITGSNGKTSTKDMVAAILSEKFKTLKTMGNFNNHIGLPLTLLKLDAGFQAAVVEMGMRGPEEIEQLARIAEPTGAVITIIGESHLELLGTVENIAQAKGEILDHIDQDKFAVLNGDDLWQRKLACRAQGEIIYYGIGKGVDIQGFDIKSSQAGTTFKVRTQSDSRQMFLPVPGVHNVMNALAGIGVGLQLGLNLAEIEKGLSKIEMTGMRLEILDKKNYIVINDAYNASPSSMKAALKTLQELTVGGKSIAVLGNMFELGERTGRGHEEVGQEVAELNINELITVGDYAADIASAALSHGLSPKHIYRCEDNKQAIKILKEIIASGDTILVKGSRGMNMEEIVENL